MSTEVRANLLEDFATEIRSIVGDLVVAAQSYRAACDSDNSARIRDAWGCLLPHADKVSRVLEKWAPLGIRLDDWRDLDPTSTQGNLVRAAWALGCLRRDLSGTDLVSKVTNYRLQEAALAL
jgi:hypothetical protein